MLEAIIKEIDLRADYLEGQTVETIYFGGGTPSLLDSNQLKDILLVINNTHTLNASPEITIEANPDDLSERKCEELMAIGINRLSIGIQSFDNAALKTMNRAHDSGQAATCLQTVKKVGFQNVSLDLIFATPPVEGSLERLQSDLNSVIAFSPEHVSVYGLTIEPQTAFGNWVEKGTLAVPDEDDAARQFDYLIETLKKNGYEQYEVSNFSKPGFYSKHNTSYWEGKNYLGIGPGAHSFNGQSRSFNVRNNAKYISQLGMNEIPKETEVLSETQKLNEYLLTRIRTKWGIDLNELKTQWQFDLMKDHEPYIRSLIADKRAVLNGENLYLTSWGFQIADEITLRLFSDE